MPELPDIESIKPTRKQRVYDLVQDAGLDVSDWANYADGEKNPATNPRYCYEWAFMGESFAIFNLWYEDMEVDDGGIKQILNQRAFGRSQRGTAGRAPVIRRAESMDSILKRAFQEGIPARVIVCFSGDGKNKVSRRGLDTEFWSVSEYDDDNGRAVIRRGFEPRKYYDQFSPPPLPAGNSTPEKTTSTTTQYERDSKVRDHARKRAKGRCEYCRSLGFRTAGGGIFLETHHVIPLSEGGPDTPDNVIALCPNHHREAHHGANQSLLRERFRKTLRNLG